MEKRILILASLPESLINFRGDLIRHFLANSFEVHVAAPEIRLCEQTYSTLQSLNVKVHEISLKRNKISPLNDITYMLKLVKIIKEVRPSYLLAYTIKPVVYGSIAAKMCRVPRINAMITGVGSVFQKRGLKGTILKKLVNWLYWMSLSNINKIIFQNCDDRHYFVQSRIITDERCTAIVDGSGVNLDYFSPKELPKKMSFLMIARLLKEKGIREYLQAADMVKMKYPDVEFGLLGWFDDEGNSFTFDELNNYLESGSVNYFGRCEDVRPFIAGSSVYVLPSYREGTPRTVLEAMAMGRPIITTDAPGCKETTLDSVNGYLVPVGSANLLALAMMKFIENPKDVEQMGAASLKIVQEKYDVNIINEAMFSLITE